MPAKIKNFVPNKILNRNISSNFNKFGQIQSQNQIENMIGNQEN